MFYLLHVDLISVRYIREELLNQGYSKIALNPQGTAAESSADHLYILSIEFFVISAFSLYLLGLKITYQNSKSRQSADSICFIALKMRSFSLHY